MLRAAPGCGNGHAFGHRSAGNVFPDNGLGGLRLARGYGSYLTTTGVGGGYVGLAFPRTIAPMKRLIAPSLVIALCGMAAARDQGPDTELSSKAVAKLEAKLGESEIQVDQVRVTDDGIACIDFHGTGSTGGKKGHAVVQGEQLLISTNSDKNGFEKAWSQHCLGPRGGATPAQ